MKTQSSGTNSSRKTTLPLCYRLKQKLAIALGLVVALLLVPSKTSAQAAWTGTWGVTPQSGGNSFNQQTIRQIVYTSAGGSSARLRLSNLFGAQSAVISDVHIALAGSGSSIQPGTDHVVTFGGSGSVTIGAGAEANSDSIPMTIPSLAEVAISFYLPNSTNVQTIHQFSFQSNYVANGDVSGSTNLSVVSTPASYFLITNLDVQSPALTGAVVTLGASITDGYASTQNANHRWPNFLAQRLSSAGIDVGVINQGVSGNQLLNNNNTLSALNRFQHDAVGQPNVKWVIFSDDPINDVGNNSSITGAQLIAGVKQLISQAHSNGLKFLGSTLTPFHGAGGWTAAGETARDQYNAFILSSSSGCDGVVDQDTATHDPSNPTQFLPAYDSGDHIHPNDAGYQAIANAVNLSLFGTPTEAPFGGTPAAIPGTIQNENYDTGGQGVAYNVTSINGTDTSYRSDSVDLENTSDVGGGDDLGWTSAGQWFKYTVNVATAGTYTVSLRVAAATAVGTNAGSFHLQTPSGANLSGAINVPGTGGWQTWTTITANVTLPAGQQIIELFQDTGGYNFNYMTFASAGTAPVISSPGTASGTVGAAFSYQITASNTPTSYAATGLPAGLSVNASTGLISGTPTTAGTSSVTLSATNASGTGNQALTLTVTQTQQAANPWELVGAADFNGDGKPDLIWQNTVSGQRAIWLMNGTTYVSSVSLGTVATDWDIAGAADFNGDGKPDLIWQNTVNGQRAIWLMNGTTYVSSVSLGTVTSDWQIAGAADFNKNGNSDLIWQNTKNGQRAIWLMNGATYVSSVSLGTVTTDWQIVGAADLNGDGNSDLIWQNTVSGQRAIWLMNGTTYVSSVSLGTVTTNWNLAGAADFNGDGKPDLIWQDTASNQYGFWLMNGTTYVSSSVFTLGLPQLSAPSFNPAGGTYTSAQNVTISDATSSVSIRYTTDGSTPSETNGTLYSGPVNIGSTTTLKAIAYANGYIDSPITSASYTITTGGAVAPPTFNPPGGTYTSAQNVTISDTTSGASIRYTTDGSAPSETNGTVYSGPVNISSTTTLQALAYKSGFTDSSITSSSYAIVGGPDPITQAQALRVVAQYAGIFNSPPSQTNTQETPDGPLLGNGNVGVLILNNIDTMTFILHKTEFWSLSAGQVKAMARMSLSIPGMSGASYSMQEYLATGEVSGNFTSGGNKITTNSWVQADDAKNNRFFTQFTYNGSGSQTVTVSLSRGNSNSFPTSNGTSGNVIYLDVSADPSTTFNGYNTHQVRVAACVIGATGTVSNNQLQFTLTPGMSCTLATCIMSNYDSSSYQGTAISNINSLTPSNITTYNANHGTWWDNFYAKSFVEIPNKTIEREFYASLYLLACCSRANCAPPGLWGDWVMTDPAWNSDYTLNYNYETPFYLSFPTNHVELAASYDAPVINWVPNAEAEAARNGWTGAFYRVHIGPLPNGSGDTSTHNQKFNNAYAATDMLMHYYYTHDNAYANSIYATIKAMTTFWQNYLSWNGSTYDILNDAQQEDDPSPQTNGVMSLGLVKFLLQGAIDLSTALNVDSGPRATWQNELTHISPFPTFVQNGQTVFSWTSVGRQWAGGNTIGIQHIYPGSQIGLASPTSLLQIANNMVGQMARWSDGNGTDTFYPAAVRVGYNPSTILSNLTNWINGNTYPNLHIHTGGGGIENFNTVPSTLAEMFLQSFQNNIIVFPDWPSNTNAKFGDLLAYGNFLVSGDIVNNAVQYVRIVSQAGLPCSISNPWPGQTVQLYRNGANEGTLSGATLVIPTSTNDVLHLAPAGTSYSTIITEMGQSLSQAGSGGGGSGTDGLGGSAYNVNAIYPDATAFSSGIDGSGATCTAFSATLLGSSVNWNGYTFTLGPANAANGVSNTTASLTAGQFANLQMLALGVNGNQASQAFTVHYTDGTTSTFTQSLSDWATPQSYSGESIAVTMAYRDQSAGTMDSSKSFFLYGYTFALNSGKTVSSITLPANRNVVVIAVELSH